MLEELSCDAATGPIRVQAAAEEAGYPVLVHPGTPGSRHLFGPQVEQAARRGIRLVSWDRPGYGDTPGRPGRRVAEAAREASAVADRLDLGRFAVWGFSGGGPFALACAALLPDRVSAAVIMASLAPWDAPGLDWTGRFSERGKAEVRLFFDDPPAYRKWHAASAAEELRSRGTPEGWLAIWGDRAESDEAHGRAMAEHLALELPRGAARGRRRLVRG